MKIRIHFLYLLMDIPTQFLEKLMFENQKKYIKMI